MMSPLDDRRPANPSSSRGWFKRSLVVFIAATTSVAIVVAIASHMTSPSLIADKAASFADIMQIVRPLLLAGIMLAWRPAFHWMLERDWVSQHVHQRAVTYWPQLVLWICLVEVTIGQGYILLGGLGLLIYIAYQQFGRGRHDDRR